MPNKKIAVVVVATHPIQYQTPWFCALAQRAEIALEVWFLDMPDPTAQGKGFGVAFSWDIPLLEGYRWRHLAAELAGARLRYAVGLLRRERPDVLLLTGWQSWPLVQLARAARCLGISCLVRGDSNAMKRRPFVVRVWHRWLLSHYDAFLCVGRANREFYLGYGVQGARLFEVPHFVDNARFQAAADGFAPRRMEWRQSLGVPSECVCFLYVGKLEPKKRILDLLEAVRLAPAAPLHLLVVGAGELMHEAQHFAARHGLPVSFAGFLNQSEVARAYVAADCLVLPSDYGETWGLVVNEAMACGLPAIVSNRVGCGPDLVEPGVTGNIFPIGDSVALAGMLAAMAAHPEQLRGMGGRARKRVLRDYSVERAVAGTLAAVQYVTGQR